MTTPRQAPSPREDAAQVWLDAYQALGRIEKVAHEARGWASLDELSLRYVLDKLRNSEQVLEGCLAALQGSKKP